MELGVDDVDEDALAADLDRSNANVHLLEKVGRKDEGILRLDLHLQRMRCEALNQMRRLSSSQDKCKSTCLSLCSSHIHPLHCLNVDLPYLDRTRKAGSCIDGHVEPFDLW